MTSEIMNSMLKNILYFMDNAPCNPEDFVVSYSIIKVVFLPKNTSQNCNL